MQENERFAMNNIIELILRNKLEGGQAKICLAPSSYKILKKDTPHYMCDIIGGLFATLGQEERPVGRPERHYYLTSPAIRPTIWIL